MLLRARKTDIGLFNTVSRVGGWIGEQRFLTSHLVKDEIKFRNSILTPAE